MEVTEKIIRDLVATFASKLEQEGLDGVEIIAADATHLGQLQSWSRTVFEGWARLALARTQACDYQ